MPEADAPWHHDFVIGAEPSRARAFAYLARALTSTSGTQPVLEGLVHHAAEIVPARWAVALVADRITTTMARLVASTDREVTDVVAQISAAAGTGPGWWAFENGALCAVPDLAAEDRFGGYSPAMIERTPIRSVLAVPLVGGGDVVGVLTLYTDRRDAFGQDEVQRALMVASFAGVALAAARAEERADNLEAALHTNRTIGTAVGILVERHRLTDDQAFEVLRQCSMRGNRKLADIADRLVRSGDLPGEAEGLAWVRGRSVGIA
jgi:GAF domain-containing protein